MQHQPSRPHGEAADVQIDVVLAPDQIEQILGRLTGGDGQGCKVFLLPERALAGIAGLGGHVWSFSPFTPALRAAALWFHRQVPLPVRRWPAPAPGSVWPTVPGTGAWTIPPPRWR